MTFIRIDADLTGDSPDALEERAGSGDAEAMFRLGIAYRDGLLGLVPDVRRARREFLRSADAGNGLALVCAGDIEADSGHGSRASDLYLRASSRRVPEAEERLASMFLRRDDPERALDHAERGAVLGSGYCMYVLGRIYFDGIGVEQDHMHALYWFSRCCRGHPAAMRYVGIIRMEKDTPYFDMYKGLAALRLAANAHDEESRRRLLDLRLDVDTDDVSDDYFEPPDIPQYYEPILERMRDETVPETKAPGLFSRLFRR